MGRQVVIAVHGTCSVVSGWNWARDGAYGKEGVFVKASHQLSEIHVWFDFLQWEGEGEGLGHGVGEAGPLSRLFDLPCL